MGYGSVSGDIEQTHMGASFPFILPVFCFISDVYNGANLMCLVCFVLLIFFVLVEGHIINTFVWIVM